MQPQEKLPRSARALIIAVAAAGLAIVTVRSFDLVRWTNRDVVAWAALAAGIALAEQFTLSVRYRTETLNFSLTEGLWIAALILARPSVLTLAVGAGIIVGHTLRRWAPYKAAFNVGQFLVAVTLAQIVFRSLHAHGALQPRTWLATGLAMAVYAAVNASLVALVISLVEKRPFPAVLLPPLPANALHFLGNTVIGLGGAMMWSASPWVFPLVVVPLVTAFIVYRMLLRTVHQRDTAGVASA
jgi:hypothetical protein